MACQFRSAKGAARKKPRASEAPPWGNSPLRQQAPQGASGPLVNTDLVLISYLVCAAAPFGELLSPFQGLGFWGRPSQGDAPLALGFFLAAPLALQKKTNLMSLLPLKDTAFQFHHV